MDTATNTITRTDLGATFEEIDLARERLGFIGSRVFTPRIVGLQSADAGRIPLEQLLQAQSTDRTATGGYPRSSWTPDKFVYSTEDKGHEEVLSDRKVKIYRDIFDAEQVASKRLVDIVLRAYEITCASLCFDPTVWTGSALTTALTHEWDDAENALPVDDVDAAIEKVEIGSGSRPNALIMSSTVFRNVRKCNQVVERLKYAGFDDPSKIGRKALAALFDLDHILVAGSIKNTAAAGEGSTAANARIWSNEYAMVAKVAETDDPEEACIGRTYLWSEENAPGVLGEELALIAEQYFEEGVRGRILRQRFDRDIKVVYPECGHLLSNVTTI